MKRIGWLVLATTGLAALLNWGPPVLAQVAPTLGVAAQFGALGASAVTGSAAPGTVVSGDVGSYPTPTITNFPPSSTSGTFIIHRAADGVVQQAQADALTAYTFLAGQGGATLPGPAAPDELGGRTLTSGVYALGAANLAGSTALTLNGPGVFIFNISSTLVMNTSSTVTGTANPCNVYWRVGTSATLNGSSFMGTVIANTSITVGGGTVTGRVLALNGAVTMPTGGNTIGGCSAPPVACPIITLSPPTLPNAAVGVAYSQTIVASGGAGPFTFSVTSGTLPAGLTLTAAGVLAGTPTTAGPFTFTITASDPAGCSGSITYTVSVAAACPVITLTPPVLPLGRVGVAYSQLITPSGGAGAYVFSVVSGTLPAGITLSAGGLLAGTPTTVGSSTVTIRVTDGNGCPGTIVYTIVVAPAACPVITIAPPVLPPGKVGVAYSQQITASGGAGTPVFTMVSGTLPTGLTLSAGGLVSGTPSTVGSSIVTIRATDGNGCPADIVYTIVVAAAACPVITLTPPTLPVGSVGVAYSQQITATGGTGSPVFSVASGTLPAGLTLSSSGLLSGTPTTAGPSTVSIQALDGVGCPGVVLYTITIGGPAPVPTLPQAFVLLLALGLTGAGYVRLRRRARG
jgi:large repetitive protein